MFVAVVLIGFEEGILGIYIGCAYLMGCLLLAMTARRARRLLRSNGSETVFHLIELQLSTRVTKLYVGISALLFTAAIASQLIAIEQFVPGQLISVDIGIQVPLPLLLLLLAAAFYTVRGGLTKDIWSDVLQTIYVAVGLSLITLQLVQGRLWNSTDSLSSSFLSGGSFGPMQLAAAIVLLVPMLLVRPDLWQRTSAAKTTRDAQIAFIITGVVMLIAFSLFTAIGVIGRLQGLSGESTLLLSVAQLAGASSLVQTLIVLAFMGAVLSSLDTLMNIAGLAITRIVRVGRDAREKYTSLVMLRFYTAGATVLAGLGYFLFADLVDLLALSLSFVMVLAPPVLDLLFRGRADEPGAFWSIAFGAVVLVVAAFAWSPRLAFIPAALLGWSVYYIFVAIRSIRR